MKKQIAILLFAAVFGIGVFFAWTADAAPRPINTTINVSTSREFLEALGSNRHHPDGAGRLRADRLGPVLRG